ncbi:MAG TPA: hypothetical protein VN026_09830 [Bacteroidia bacterium]|jgi:hypothetical protein|nr:hypothetical protein [Bacteroidia bacterium]
MKSPIHSLFGPTLTEKKNQGNRKKFPALFFFFLLQFGALFSQTLVYDNFDGNKSIRYTERTGVFDSIAKNPKIDSVNSSAKCGLYIRNKGKKFDNIKMELPGFLADVSSYATYLGIPPKLKMKIYTNAPVGTLVEILLGNKNGNNDYPAGTNSQYQTYTTKTNAWEVVEFKFSQIPQGSQTSTSQINQVTLLFNPNSSTSDAYYFDEITGPSLAEGKSDAIVTPEPKKSEPVKKTNTTKKIAKK